MSAPTDLRDRPAPELVPDLPEVVVDPRFRERRIAVRKDAGRRRLKRLLVLIAVALVALGTVIVLRSPVLDVDEVVVRGTSATDADDIRDLVGIDIGAPLLLADLDGAEAAVEELAWVKGAEVSRDLPGGIIVDVVEREAAAVVSGAGQAVLVDVEGTVLEPAPASASPPFVHVVVDEAPPQVGASVPNELAVAIDLASRLRANPSGVVTAVHLDPSLRLQLLEGAVVDLGDERALDDKVEAFRTVYARVDRTCLERIDLRVPTHPVLTREDGCS